MNENRIDQYLLNLLSPEEKSSFEKQLQEDENLMKEFLLHKETFETIEGIGRVELKSRLKKIHSEEVENQNGESSNIRSLISKFAIAASFVGLIAFGWWWMQQPLTPADLYSQNFEPFELTLNQRSGSEKLYDDIETAYAKGDFENAIALFKTSLEKQDKRSSQLLLGLGISYMEGENPQNAIPYFNEIIDNKDFNFEDESHWYLGLAYLKMNDIPNAKVHFEILASDPSKDHHEQSVDIVSNLNKNGKGM